MTIVELEASPCFSFHLLVVGWPNTMIKSTNELILNGRPLDLTLN
jgi:hypothetical protein